MSKAPEPSRELVLKVRSGFVAQGTTLTTWCRENDVHITAARQVLLGVWNGPKGRELRRLICAASGVIRSAA
jgi:hypothetical protein